MAGTQSGDRSRKQAGEAGARVGEDAVPERSEWGAKEAVANDGIPPCRPNVLGSAFWSPAAGGFHPARPRRAG